MQTRVTLLTLWLKNLQVWKKQKKQKQQKKPKKQTNNKTPVKEILKEKKKRTKLIIIFESSYKIVTSCWTIGRISLSLFTHIDGKKWKSDEEMGYKTKHKKAI